MIAASAQQPFRRQWPLIALAVGSVFEYRFGRSPSVTLMELLSLGVLGLLFLDRVALGSRFDRQIIRGIVENRWLVAFYLWSCVCAVAAVAVRGNALNIWLFRDYFPAMVLVLVVSIYGCTRDQFIRLVYCYIVAASLIAVMGISQNLFGAPYIRAYHAVTDAKMDLEGKVIVGVFKATGLFGHPNALAAFILLPFGMSVALLRERGVGAVRCLALLAACGVFCGALAATYSKGAWAWAAISISLILLWPRSLFRFRSIPVLLAVVFSCLLLFGSIYLAHSGHRSFLTMLTRVGLWQAAWYVSSDDPYVWLFGNGQMLMPWISNRFSDISYPNAHSSFLNIPLFYGAIGASIFIAAVVSGFRSLRRFSDSAYGDWSVGWALSVLLPVYCFYSLFEPHLEDGGNLVQFFLLLAFCGVLGRMKNERS